MRTLIGRGVERLLYVYDFGDDWRHDVIIEDVRDGAPDIDYPAFVAGERRCPPEDVGGAPGFMQFLEAALNPFHDEHEEVLTWYLGRLCDFNTCPKGKAECRVPGCGEVTLLRQHEWFRWRAESLAEGRAVRLFERATGLQRCASDLPLLEVEAG